MGVLEQILEAKERELAALHTLALPEPPPRRPIALKRANSSPLSLIAEIKRRSPSAGQLSTALSIGERATCYEKAGASMVSVLCDGAFFDGSFEHLAEARRACSLPLLCKEFIIDEIQLKVARAFGADAVLLIVRCIPEAHLQPLVQAARALGLEPLVEVCTEPEAALALASGAQLIGVNARDLDTLQMNPERARKILAGLPEERVRIHLSGVATAEEVAAFCQGPADAVLIGEALMRQADPFELLCSLVEAAGSAGSAGSL